MTELQGQPISYWLDSTDATEFPSISGPVEVDVAVVGGGIAGICTAWEVARTGRSVALLEGDRLAYANTGNTTAKLTALHTLKYAKLAHDHGADVARLYGRSQAEAVGHVAKVCTELGIDCDLERLPAYTYTESAERIAEFEREAEAALDAGLPASFTTETGLPFPVAGAVKVENQSQFHPRRYLLALVDDLVARGGLVFERTRVVDLDEGDPCRLTTESDHEVVARDVVIATHYPVFDRALLFPRLLPRRELVVTAAIEPSADPAGMYITTEENTRSVRTAPFGEGQRLLIVTGEHFRPGEGAVGERFVTLAAWMDERFGTGGPNYHWAAQDNGSSDGLPFIGHLHPRAKRAWVAAGFGGWGMSNGVLAGQLLSELIAGTADPDLARVYDPARVHVRAEAPSVLRNSAAVAKHFVGDRVKRAGSVDDIAPGQGAVVRVDGKRCAVHRDDAGVVHGVSPNCTHQGCLVAFNDAERTWDCPCHGSRFGVDGSVLQGPAIEPLKAMDVPEAGKLVG